MHPNLHLGALYQIVVRKPVRPCSDKYLHAFYKVTTVFKSDRQGDQNDHGGGHSIWLQCSNAFEGWSKVTPLSRLARIPMLSQHSPKIKQGIPATPNVPEPLVFSGFSNILFMPFVSIKRFTFLCKRCLWYNSILPLYFLILPILFDFAP